MQFGFFLFSNNTPHANIYNEDEEEGEDELGEHGADAAGVGGLGGGRERISPWLLGS
jgi:hypothetical protein